MALKKGQSLRSVALNRPRFDCVSLNYNDKLKKITAILGCWKLRRLGFLEKITVLKSLVASQLTYIFSPLQTNNKVIKKINGMFYNLWNDKGDKNKTKYNDKRLL